MNIIRTEVWTRKTKRRPNVVIKAVVRRKNGQFLGETNKTAEYAALVQA